MAVTKKPIAPCLRCTIRRPECHGTCDNYQQYESDKKEYKEWLRKQRMDNYVPRYINGNFKRRYGR